MTQVYFIQWSNVTPSSFIDAVRTLQELVYTYPEYYEKRSIVGIPVFLSISEIKNCNYLNNVKDLSRPDNIRDFINIYSKGKLSIKWFARCN